MALPITPYDEAGPLYGLVWPILISLSVAPSSYFFCAYDTLDADTMAAAEAPPRKLRRLVLNAILQQLSLCGNSVAGIRLREKSKIRAANIQTVNVAVHGGGLTLYELSACMISPNSSQVSPLKRCN